MLFGHACVRQHDQFDCGAAVLATVARHHGLAIGIGRIRELVGTDRIGTNLLGLSKGAEAIGFSAKGVKGDWDGLTQVPLPAVCHSINDQKLGHFLVVHRIRKDRVLVADPGKGLITLTKDEFLKQWTGFALLLTPKDLRSAPTTVTKGAFLRELLIPHRGVLASALVYSLILTVLGLGTSFFVQHLVDHILVHAQTRVLDFAIAGMVLLLLFRVLFDFVRSYYLIDIARKVDLTLVSCYVRHLLHMPMRFFETRRVGEILSRLNDAVKIRQLISSTALTSIVDGTMIFAAMAMMLLTEWRLALVCILFAPFVFGMVFLLRKPLARRQRSLMERSADLEGQLVEDFTGIESIKAYGTEGLRLQKSETKLVRIAQNVLAAGKFGVWLQVFSTLVVGGATLATLGFGGHLVIDGELTIGKLMFFYSLTGYLYGPLERLANVSVSLQDTVIALDRLWEILSLELEGSERAAKAVRPKRLASGIRFERVSFGYGYRGNVLEGIDLVIPAGKVVALVGESGCGKSTLCKLIAKYYEPTTGRILVDDLDLRDLSLPGWRKQIGYVSQDAHIFSGTIAENIALGRPRAPLSRIMRAARFAGLDTFIDSLPNRYDTVIGERGMNLSGGQRQRLSIARAILPNPRIFIFDEATSHLDTRTERAIQETLARAMRHRTGLIVAHRLSTIRNADLIHVLERGAVAESGSHEQLIAKRGAYWQLWCAQNQVVDSSPPPPAFEATPTTTPVIRVPERAPDAEDDSTLYVVLDEEVDEAAGRVLVATDGRALDGAGDPHAHHRP
jgi:ATP-binding cassette, subfamily C, bacteriocin exporter